MDSFITLTDHAKHRAIRRFGIPKEDLLILAEKAITDGYSYRDAPNDDIAEYLERHARQNKAYVWSGYIFILDDDLTVITTYRMPRRLLLTLEREQTYIGA